MVRPRFDASRGLVAARGFTFLGHDYEAGDPFPIAGSDPIPIAKLKTIYGSRFVNHTDKTVTTRTEAGDPVTMEATGGGYYDIAAPWLDEPIRVRGKAKAEAEAAALREAGEPSYHHGVGVYEVDNGWWEVQADWSADPEKVHGEQAARERAAEIRREGPPPDPRTDVTIFEQDDIFFVNAPWAEAATPAGSRADAEAEQQRLREAGPPEGWQPAPEAE